MQTGTEFGDFGPAELDRLLRNRVRNIVVKGRAIIIEHTVQFAALRVPSRAFVHCLCAVFCARLFVASQIFVPRHEERTIH